MTDATHEHGWTAVPRSLEKLIKEKKSSKSSTPVTIDEISLPTGDLVLKVTKYARDNLPIETFNHSMRVYYFGKSRYNSKMD